MGLRPEPPLQPLAVDLEELSELLEGDPLHGGGQIDLRTGEVWPEAAIEYAEEIGELDPEQAEDPERWLWVECEGSHEGYRDMERFIASVAESDRKDLLEIAIQGRGAFRRFRDVLARWPGELDRWYSFSEDHRRGRARAWLRGAGYRVAVATTPQPPFEKES